MNADLEIRADVLYDVFLTRDKNLIGIPISQKSIKFLTPLPMTIEATLRKRIAKKTDLIVPMDRLPEIYRGDKIVVHAVKEKDFPADGYKISQIDVIREDSKLRASYFIH